jgi:hypothetical protein
MDTIITIKTLWIQIIAESSILMWVPNIIKVVKIKKTIEIKQTVLERKRNQ